MWDEVEKKHYHVRKYVKDHMFPQLKCIRGDNKLEMGGWASKFIIKEFGQKNADKNEKIRLWRLKKKLSERQSTPGVVIALLP